jgi:CRP-like cAMP-binding protein
VQISGPHGIRRIELSMSKTQLTKQVRMLSARKIHGVAVDNLILGSIPDKEFALVEPHIEMRELPVQTILSDPQSRFDTEYFLNSGLASFVVPTSDGKTVEVAVAGRGGFAGAPILFSLKKSLLRVVIQVSGTACVIKSGPLEKVLASTPVLRMKMGRYALFLGMQAAQTAACNRLHSVQPRLARWLLMTQERVGSEFAMTQDYLAQILGSARVSVSQAANALRREGAIDYSRGMVRIQDRRELEEMSCECYASIRECHDELAGRLPSA